MEIQGLALLNLVKKYCVFVIPFMLLAMGVTAQPVNDDCAGAINIPNVANSCTAVGGFTTVGSTPSGYAAPTCWANKNNDVWFTFTTIATDVTITVLGNLVASPGGTMPFPEVALYSGVCGGTINQERCDTDLLGNGIVELYKGGLTIGQQYFIRVNTPIVSPGSDCPLAAVLCNKKTFTVQRVVGAGAQPNEAQGTCLDDGSGFSESNSTWFVWTCQTSGTLTFDLTPTNISDDLDFVVYELPGGLNDCSGKVPIRCMAAGDNGFPSVCMGVTGLDLASTDVIENPGCNDAIDNPPCFNSGVNCKDNYVAAVNMVAGRSYGLMINNFTSTGNGFTISFGGTGTFLGPNADFSTAPTPKACIGETITFTDNSSFALGSITNYEWNFGVGASPATATGIGPHNVSYNTAGQKSTILSVTTNLGCVVSSIRSIQIDTCCESLNKLTVSGVKTDESCFNYLDGSITLNPITTSLPIQYSWNDGSSQGPARNNLQAGIYSVTVTNFAGCDTILNFTIVSPPEFTIDTTLGRPSCGGGSDGSITLTVGGASPPYMYNFGAGFGMSNSLLNIPAGDYPITIRDANGCDTMILVPLRELEILLNPTVQAVQEPDCFGGTDGSITVVVLNGKPPYTYDFGSGPQASNILQNIGAGAYSVTVTDDNLCTGIHMFTLNEPDSLDLMISGTDVSCFGYTDGEGQVIVNGGTAPYTYLWSDPGASGTAIATNLAAGTYTVTVTDAQMCSKQATVTLNQPDSITIDSINVINAACFGSSDGTVEVYVSGGNPPFEYSVDNLTFQTSNTIPNLQAGTYRIYIRDMFGCTFEGQATITEPTEIVIDAGPDRTIKLGDSTDILVTDNTGLPLTYSWSPDYNLSCNDCYNPNAKPFFTTTYVVTATDPSGCEVEDDVIVFINPQRDVYIPNVFTPNRDGKNDFFTIFGGISVRTIRSFKIFDRWGGLIWEDENFAPNRQFHGWNGRFNDKYVNPGIYVYMAEVEFLDDRVVVYSGDVTVLR